jgi:hypothetical protein
MKFFYLRQFAALREERSGDRGAKSARKLAAY